MNSSFFDNSSVVSHPSDNSCLASPCRFPVVRTNVKTTKKGVPEAARFGQNPKTPLRQGFSSLLLVFCHQYLPGNMSIKTMSVSGIKKVYRFTKLRFSPLSTLWFLFSFFHSSFCNICFIFMV